MKKLKTFQQRYGNLPISERGLLDFPGQKVIVPTEDGKISMKGIPYPVLGKDDTGKTKLMFPEQEYKFQGTYVYECPIVGPSKIKNADYEMRTGGEKRNIFAVGGQPYDPNQQYDEFGRPIPKKSIIPIDQRAEPSSTVIPPKFDPNGKQEFESLPAGPPIPVVNPQLTPRKTMVTTGNPTPPVIARNLPRDTSQTPYNIFDRQTPLQLDPNQGTGQPNLSGSAPTGGTNQQEFIKPKDGLISPTPGYDPWKINETGKPENFEEEKKKKEPFTLINGKKTANRILTGMSLLNSILEKKEYEEEYRKQKERLGNTNAMNTEFQGFAPYGDYTLNAGMGQNFRPNETQYAQYYQYGGERASKPLEINDRKEFDYRNRMYNDSLNSYNTGLDVARNIGSLFDKDNAGTNKYRDYYDKNYKAGKLKYPLNSNSGSDNNAIYGSTYTKKDVTGDTDPMNINTWIDGYNTYSPDDVSMNVFRDSAKQLERLNNNKIDPTALSTGAELPPIVHYKKPTQPVVYKDPVHPFYEDAVRKIAAEKNTIAPATGLPRVNRGRVVTPTTDTTGIPRVNTGRVVTPDPVQEKVIPNKKVTIKAVSTGGPGMYIVNTGESDKALNLSKADFDKFVATNKEAWDDYVRSNNLKPAAVKKGALATMKRGGEYVEGGEYTLSKKQILDLQSQGYEIDLL